MRFFQTNIAIGKAHTSLRYIALVLCCVVASMQAFSQSTPSRAYQIKAGFLYNFLEFVEWPPASFEDDSAPFVIGIVGKDPFGDYLDKLVAGEKMNGHPIVVRRYNGTSDIKPAHLVFINSPEEEKILKALISKSTLTISDALDFAQTGGMIQFYTENNKIRLKINPSAAKAANLNISSKLLRLADIVE